MDTKKHESAVEALSQAISILVDTFSISNNVEGINPTEKQKTIVEALTEMRDNILHYSVEPDDHVKFLQNELERKSKYVEDLGKSNEVLTKRICNLTEEIGDARRELTIKDDAIKAWQEISTKTTDEKQKLYVEIADLKRKVEIWKEQAYKLDEQRKFLLSENNKLKDENDTLYRNAKKSEKQYEFYLSINN